MATKANQRFLPFVGADSPLSAIYDKLSEGSQGIPENVVLGILRMVDSIGLEDVRRRLSAFNHISSWKRKFNGLLAQYPIYKVPFTVPTCLKHLKKYIKQEDIVGVALEYHNLPIAYVVASGSGDDKNLGCLSCLKTLCSDDYAFINLKEKRVFSSHAGTTMEFSSKHELLAYCFYVAHISIRDVPTVTAILSDKPALP